MHKRIINCIMLIVCVIVSVMPEALAEETVVKVGYFSDEVFHRGAAENERKSGYGYAYYQEIAKYNDWKYEYVYGSRNEIYQKLQDGEIDIMCDVSKEIEGAENLLFSKKPMGTETYYIFVSEDNTTVQSDDSAAINGMRIGINPDKLGEQYMREYAEANGITYTPVMYREYDDRVEALENGEIDAMVTTDTYMTGRIRPVTNIGERDCYFALAPGREELLSELDRVQSIILSNNPNYHTQLREKYYYQNIIRTKLTDDEKAWVDSHPNIKIGYLDNYMPFSSKNEDGTPDGLITALLPQLSEYMGIEFTAYSYESQTKLLAALENGDIDVVFPTYEDMWYSERRNYMQTPSVVSDRVSVIYKGDYDKLEYGRIAVWEQSPVQSLYVSTAYPEAEQIKYRDINDALNAVSRGEVDCMAASNDIMRRLTNDESKFTDLKISATSSVINYCFAVRRTDTELYSLLTMALNRLDSSEVTDTVIRYLYAESDYSIRDFLRRNATAVTLVFIVLLLIIVLWYIMYRKKSEDAKRTLKEAYEREKEYIASEEIRYNIIKSLIKLYFVVYYIDLEDYSYMDVLHSLNEHSAAADKADSKRFFAWIESNVLEQSRDDMAEFFDMTTLKERLKSEDSVQAEYETMDHGWCRGSFIVAGRGADGEADHVLWVVQKIDEERRKEIRTREALKEAYDAANRANDAKSTFLSNMSHDIRTPMNAIVGMTALAGAQIDDKKKVLDCLGKITTASKHLLALINEVLDMSKIESGKINLSEEDFNLSEMVDQLIILVRPQTQAHGHKLTVRVQDVKHENVIGDSLRLQQALVNILSNAIKYTPDGGKIELSIRETKIQKSGIACYEFICEDNGIGMDKDFLETVFEPFTRAAEGGASEIQGTGLGLAITRNVIRMMSGDIAVESTPGKGSKFTVTVYLRIQENDSYKDEKFADLPILVADDDKDTCLSTCVILDDLGMKSEWVQSGEEVVAKVAAAHEDDNDFFAVLLDWKMSGGMDGVTTTREIRKRVGPDVPIIIVSAYDWSEIEKEAREAGATCFVSKPLFRSRLVEVFKQLLEGESDNDQESNQIIRLGDLDFTGKRALVVEDNQFNAEILEAALTRTKMEVELAKNGKEAVEKFVDAEDGYFDIVFMDVQMPIMNGYEATRTIRSLSRDDCRKVPIIALTANAFAADIKAALEAGMNEHVAKPIDFKQIGKTLVKWLK